MYGLNVLLAVCYSFYKKFVQFNIFAKSVEFNRVNYCDLKKMILQCSIELNFVDGSRCKLVGKMTSVMYSKFDYLTVQKFKLILARVTNYEVIIFRTSIIQSKM